jgi:hypothetical protein
MASCFAVEATTNELDNAKAVPGTLTAAGSAKKRLI